MKILLARHGETPWNAEGRYQGQEDIALSPVGEAQARALGERLRDVRIDRAVASPLSRARRTAELALGDARVAMLTTDPGLMEIAHGTWEGLLAGEIRARDPDLLQAWRDAPHEVLMPQGESLQQVLRSRLAGARARLRGPRCRRHPAGGRPRRGQPRAAVPHPRHAAVAKLWTFRQAPTTLNLLEGADVDHLDVVRLNDCSHHTPFFGEAVHRAL